MSSCLKCILFIVAILQFGELQAQRNSTELSNPKSDEYFPSKIHFTDGSIRRFNVKLPKTSNEYVEVESKPQTEIIANLGRISSELIDSFTIDVNGYLWTFISIETEKKRLWVRPIVNDYLSLYAHYGTDYSDVYRSEWYRKFRWDSDTMYPQSFHKSRAVIYYVKRKNEQLYTFLTRLEGDHHIDSGSCPYYDIFFAYFSDYPELPVEKHHSQDDLMAIVNAYNAKFGKRNE